MTINATEPPKVQDERTGRILRTDKVRQVRYWGMKIFAVAGPLPLLLVVLIVFFGFGNPVFLSSGNLSAISVQAIYLLLVTLAQVLILITGGFDLSVGANVALTSICTSLMMRSVYGGIEQYAGLALLWGFVTALIVGLVVGLANGLGVAILGVNAFIVTLATSTIFIGAAMLISGGSEVSGLPRLFTHSVGSGELFGFVPIPLLLAIPVIVALFIVLRWMKYGRYVFAIGGNPISAQVAGIRVKWNLLLTYVVAGMITAYAGWLLTARVSSGQPHLGGEFAMESITAAIIGGASLRGGRGGVGGAILGVLFIVAMTNGMNLLRMDANSQGIALGLALVFAVLIDRMRERVRNSVAVMELR
jgi:ribose/xylose/arabinose/galactoside ABC-type transport system permease subunit